MWQENASIVNADIEIRLSPEPAEPPADPNHMRAVSLTPHHEFGESVLSSPKSGRVHDKLPRRRTWKELRALEREERKRGAVLSERAHNLKDEATGCQPHVTGFWLRNLVDPL